MVVTGAGGFVGRNLCGFLKEKGYMVRGVVRNSARDISGADEYIQVGDIDGSTDWQRALAGVDTVIHLAARVHIKSDSHKKCDSHFLSVADSMEAFHKVNALGTGRLARMAAKAGVRRFIFISSIGVNGKFTGKHPFTEEDIPVPVGAYSTSKWGAEQALHEAATGTGMEAVILRPPLVYGPGVKANFRSLIKIIGSGLPLPFAGVNNRRSFLYLGNLVDAISVCITHPLAAGETFLVSDGQDVSTPDLIKMIARAISDKKSDSHLFYLHPGILKALCKIAGKTEEFEKLTGSLLIDSGKIRNLLGWKPPFTLEEGIKETVKCYG